MQPEAEILIRAAKLMGAYVGVPAPGPGVYIQPTPSAQGTQYLDYSKTHEYSVLLLSKDRIPMTAYNNALKALSGAETALRESPQSGDRWTMLSARTYTSPSLIGVDEAGYSIYSAVLSIKCYITEEV